MDKFGVLSPGTYRKSYWTTKAQVLVAQWVTPEYLDIQEEDSTTVSKFLLCFLQLV